MICEAFQCPPDVAARQDPVLCEQIIMMRSYAELSSMEKHNSKLLTSGQRRFIVQMEQAYEGA